MRKLLCYVLILLLFPIFTSAEVLFNAGSVLVMDARTGEVIYEYDGYSNRYPASITKIMTALLVIENVEDLTERIIFSEYAVDLPDDAGRIGMVAGESITVLEALYGLMLPSANEVARALAEHVSGSVEAFVALMNQRALQIGAQNTRFINPCGLPGENQHVTAYDIALIMQTAITYPLFVEIISTPYFYLPPTNMHGETRELRNSNVLIRPDNEQFNEYVIGGKTGFTNAAQHTLVTYAAYEEREIIISVLFASPRGAIFTDTAAIIDYIFFGISNGPGVIPAENEPGDAIDYSDDADEMAGDIEIEEIEELEEPEETETVPAVSEDLPEEAPVPETPPSEEPPPEEEISDSQAALVASMSVGVASVALIFVTIIRKRKNFS